MIKSFSQREELMDFMLDRAGRDSGIVFRALRDVSSVHGERQRQSDAAAPAPEKSYRIFGLVTNFTRHMLGTEKRRADLSFEEVIKRIDVLKAAKDRRETPAIALRT